MCILCCIVYSKHSKSLACYNTVKRVTFIGSMLIHGSIQKRCQLCKFFLISEYKIFKNMKTTELKCHKNNLLYRLWLGPPVSMEAPGGNIPVACLLLYTYNVTCVILVEGVA